MNQKDKYLSCAKCGFTFHSVSVRQCKIGDTVYWIHKRFQEAGIISGTVKSIKISSFGYDLEILDSCGHAIKREFEKVFLTRPEAEQALKEARENGIHVRTIQ